ncbi:MAG: hypothetical protein WBQ50_02480 [Nocardioides sp.]
MSMDAAASRSAGVGGVEAPPRHWSELSLDGLRAYRRRLSDEEERVSYWRRLVHARIDVLVAEAHHERPLTVDELIRVLGDTGQGNGRSALVGLHAEEPLPDLPVLQEMWVTELDPHDAAAVADAISRLRVAETQLTDYRKALHGRLDAATKELMSRYREDPASALVALSRPHTKTGGLG